MSPAKHTPGPWAHADAADPIGHRIMVWSVPAATGVAHAFTLPDAELIAAAPALANQLAVVGLAFHIAHEDRGEPFEACTRRQCSDTAEALRAAGRLP